MSLAELDGARLALAINLELSHGRHGASARVELLECVGRRVARLGLMGWVEDVAMARIEAAVADLVARDVAGLILDCSRLRHVDHRSLPRLARAVAVFAGKRDGLVVVGLSTRLRERFHWTQESGGARRAPARAATTPVAGEREWSA